MVSVDMIHFNVNILLSRLILTAYFTAVFLFRFGLQWQNVLEEKKRCEVSVTISAHCNCVCVTPRFLITFIGCHKKIILSCMYVTQISFSRELLLKITLAKVFRLYHFLLRNLYFCASHSGRFGRALFAKLSCCSNNSKS